MNTSIRVDQTTLQLTIRGSGPPAVLLHGGPGIYDYFENAELAKRLAQQRTVCSYDQRGCRKSTSNGPFTVAANVDDLEAMRDGLGGGRIDVIGHSWGAMLAVAYAARHPATLRSLTLMSPIGPNDNWMAPFRTNLDARLSDDQRAALRDIDRQIAAETDETRRSELYRRRFNVALPSYMAERCRDLAPTIEHYHRRVNVETMNDLLNRYKQTGWLDGLSSLEGPALIIHGREDSLPWSVVEDLQALLPRAHVVGLEDCGHFPDIECPNKVQSAITAHLESAAH